MPRARIADRHRTGPPHELVNLTDDAEVVVRDEHGDVAVWNPGSLEWVEFECERCGRFGRDVVGPGHWTCFDSDSDAACADARGGS